MTDLQMLLDQISRQNKELKIDIKTELRELRADLKSDKHDTNKRLHILEKFKWHVTGAVMVIVFIAETIAHVMTKA